MTAKDAQNDDRGTDDKQLVEIPVEPPRDPGTYRPRDHFLQRFRDRVPEFARDLPREVIEDGRVCRVHGDTVDDSPDYGTPVAFTHTVRGDTWTVVVALRPDGYATADPTHYALTLWQGTPTPLDQGGEQ